LFGEMVMGMLMNTAKLAKALMQLGALGAILSAIWWYRFYSEVIQFLGSRPDAIWQQDTVRCMFFDSGPCGLVTGIASAAGESAYQPIAMWFSLALAIIGAILEYASND
jgi:hypothetical protein